MSADVLKLLGAVCSTPVRQLSLKVTPRRGGGHEYKRSGLCCRTVSPGVYRIRRQGGGKIAFLMGRIQFQETVAGETVPAYLDRCRTHGTDCLGGEGCVYDKVRVMVGKWLCCLRQPRGEELYFEVVVYKRRGMRSERDKVLVKPARGPGFYLSITQRADV